jgi:hypothetical protein
MFNDRASVFRLYFLIERFLGTQRDERSCATKSHTANAFDAAMWYAMGVNFAFQILFHLIAALR